MQKEKLNRRNKGITLIALIITIIVMLILVGVSVTVALNGGLFSTAKTAAEGTEVERDKELALSGGQVEVGGLVYGSIEDYRSGNIKLPDNTEKTTKETEQNETIKTLIANWDTSKVTAVKVLKDDGTLDGTIPLPKGFQISLEDGENTVTEGLVITDGVNEFVWIPVENYSSYTEDSFGPLTGTDTKNTYEYDSQEELNYYYGMKEDGITPYYNYSDFTYSTDKTNVEESIQTYGGFYVGRYETTYDSVDANGVPQGIGVKKGKDVLQASNILQTGTNSEEGKSGEAYYYRWWGLYKAQKDMYADNIAVGSLMISSKQWDAIIDHTDYVNGKRPKNSYKESGKPDKSGSSYNTNSSQYDEAKNIYDLAGNVTEFTLTMGSSNFRKMRGGGNNALSLANLSVSGTRSPNNHGSSPASLGSRVSLYIK